MNLLQFLFNTNNNIIKWRNISQQFCSRMEQIKVKSIILKNMIMWMGLDLPVWSWDKTALENMWIAKDDESLTKQVQVWGHVHSFLSHLGCNNKHYNKKRLLQVCKKGPLECGHICGKVVFCFIRTAILVKQWCAVAEGEFIEEAI